MKVPLSRLTAGIAVWCTLFFSLAASAQTPGLIVRPTSSYSAVLDLNGDGYTSPPVTPATTPPSSLGFVTTDVGAGYSEIPYKIIPPFKLEPTADLMRGPSDKFSDLVRLTTDPTESGMYMYNDGTNLLFRLRLGDIVSGSKGYSILIDADQKFGASGAYADTNYKAATSGINGNPGFELEVVLETNFRVAIYDVDGKNDAGTTAYRTYGINTNSQISIAYSTVSGTPDYFYDFYVPIADLKYLNGTKSVTATTPIRVSATTVMSPQAAIGGPKSDIYGYDGTDYMAAWEALINGQSAFTPNNMTSTGTGVSAVCTAAPTLNSPISAGTVTIGGTWTQSGAAHSTATTTVTLYRVRGGTTTVVGTATNVSSSWSVSSVNAVASDVFYAKAQSTGESSCLESNSVLVASCSTRSSVSDLNVTCASDRGFDGTAPANAVVRIYYVNSSGYTLYADESTTTYKVSRPGATTRWIYDSVNTNSSNPCTGGQADVTLRQYAITIQEPGKCESDYFYRYNNTGNTCASTTATPTVTQTALYTGGTLISGTATANATIRLFKEGGIRATTTADATGNYSFTGLSLNLGEVMDVYAHASGSCISAKVTRTVTCFSTTPVITTTNSGNLTAGATAIAGTAPYVAGTTTTVSVYNGSGVQQGTAATVQSDGTWNVTTTVASGASYYAVSQKGTCGVSAASSTITALTATTVCPTITSPITDTATIISGTLSGTFSGKVRLYQDGAVIDSVTVSNATSWNIKPASNLLYPGGVLTATTQTTNAAEKTNCTGSVTISCTAPTAPALIQTAAPVVNASGQAFFVITNSQSGVLYTLEDASSVDKSKSVFGNGGSITLTSYSYLTPGTYPLRITALKLTSSTCATTTTSVNIIVTNNDGDAVADVIDLDDDNDGILDTNESLTYDATGDGDGDGIPNYKDTSPGVTGLPATDSNADGILDYFDTDRDGIINRFDVDADNDGIPDIIENGATDSDNDGKVDNTADADLDGLRDGVDANTSGSSGSIGLALTDFDGDGVPNFKDLDSDGDGLLDSRESGLGYIAATGLNYDTNSNGLLSDDAGFADTTPKDGWSDAVDGLSGPLTLRNTDGRSKPDYLDIDNDDDGIVDNVEARATASTAIPLNTDTDGDGIDNAYDNVSTAGTFGGTVNNGLTPVNTDGDTQPDYRDTDSDNDGFPDAFEGHDTTGDNLPNANATTKNGVGGTVDADGDGLLDGYDNNTAAVNPTNSTTGIPAPNGTNYPNIDNSTTSERDWREADDADKDGIIDTVDLDDDNDGIPDVVECTVSPSDDFDNDGLLNYLDPVPGTGPAFVDANSDGINDNYDADRDGILNSSDLDSDNDGIPDVVEAGGVDANGDGRIDNFTDTDSDGLSQNVDANNTGSSSSGNGLGSVDFDGDGVLNFIDLDCDNDGIPDVVEAGGVDADGNGRIDTYADSDGDGLDSRVDGNANNDGTVENTAGALVLTGADTNNDGKADSYPQGIANTDGRSKPNFIDLDSDDDGIADITEAAGTDSDNNGKVDYTGTFAVNDTDGDGFVDTRDGDVGNDGLSENLANTLLSTGADANSDGKADSYAKANADGNSYPNPYDLDSDNDGIPDLIEAGGVDSNGDGLIDNTTDATSNGWIDTYDPSQSGLNLKTLDANSTTAGGGVFDFDGDGIANYLDLDSDGDGIPDIIEQGGTDSDNDGKVDVSTDADKDGFADIVDPLNTNTGAALGTALITTGSTLNGFNLPASYSSGDNFDAKGLINMLDLDSDDDGILDVREAGLTDATGDGTADGTLGADGWSDTVDGLSPLTLTNTDAKTGANYLDTDSDDDGIPDNIEGQSTSGYIAPANADTDADGIDNSYDNNTTTYGGNASNGITPVNTDGDSLADYLDLNSDNDAYTDRLEGWDTNGNRIIGGSEIAYAGIADADGDGLLDEYDVNDAAINPTNGTTPASYPNLDIATTTERDWREAGDNDKDGVTDNNDVDNDNDGITDLLESGNVNPFGDADNDGTPNYLDAIPGTGVPAFADTNSDGISDAFDWDKDGVLNLFDLDSDNDGIPDLVEAGGIDTNGDGRVDYTGTFAANDADGDGLINRYDVSSGNGAIGGLDTDGDGITNSFDLDSDGDGIPDVTEAAGTDTNNDGKLDTTTDTDKDGLADTVDGDVGNDGTAENTAGALVVTGTDGNNDGKPDSYGKSDFDGDGKANPYDLDSDGDGILDVLEGGFTNYDTNSTGVINSSDAGYADANGDGWSDAIAGSSLNLPNTDGSGKANYQDIDSDNDGIPDNIEGQSTTGYLAPLGTDADADGIDDRYDTNTSVFGSTTTNGITPVNTDGDSLPDHLDLDSDADGYSDRLEGWDTNGNKVINGSEVAYVGTSDADGDGLLDEYDVNDAAINPTNSTTPASYPNMDIPTTTERDWREGLDTDGDGISNGSDLDDDNDGIADTVEGSGDTDGDGIANYLDLDSDGDGIADLIEAGGIDTNGDGRVDYTGTFASNDSDGDGLINRYDVNSGNAAIGSLDSDGDGIKNSVDLDSDGDGIPDAVEAYGTDANNDGRSDATTDTDSDGWSDTVDGDVGNDGVSENMANVLILTGADTDNDGKPNSYIRGDFDNDGKVNPYDLDSDGDGIPDIWEAGFKGYDTDNNSYISSSDGYADANGDGWSDVVDNLSSLGLINTDGTGKDDWVDIDADDDGITDNVEGQTTAGYMPPSGSDSDGDGLDNQYDNLVGFGGNGITPVNTDNTDEPDFRDTDTDNDNDPDYIEGNDLNDNHKADDVPAIISTTDTDADGLLDFWESNIGNGPVVTITGFGSGTGGKSTAQQTLTTATNRDWRNSAFSLSAFTVLPVKFMTVRAAAQGTGAEVVWTVAEEQDVLHYVVERSADSGPFVQVGIVAYKTPVGTVNEYRFTDNTASGQHITYRIRQVDQDGSYTLSKTVSVQLASSVTKLLLYPNPAQDAATLQLTAAQAQTVVLHITDLQGKTVSKRAVPVLKGITRLPVDGLQQLPSGTYILSSRIDGTLQQVKFVKQ